MKKQAQLAALILYIQRSLNCVLTSVRQHLMCSQCKMYCQSILGYKLFALFLLKVLKIETLLRSSSYEGKAEREGFEPSVQLPVQRFSRPSHSTTLAPLPKNFSKLQVKRICIDKRLTNFDSE